MLNNVKVFRVDNGFTQQELAELLCVSRQTIHSIETNRYVPSTVLALKLSKYLKIPISELFSLEDTD